MAQLQRVVTNLSQELREGFWIYSNIPNMTSQKIKYIGDSRDELKNSLDCLHDLLMCKFDEDMKTKSAEIYTEFEAWHDKCIQSKDTPIKDYWKKTIKVYRKLFQELCLFLNRLEWFEVGDVEE
jgi:hypothetical protein